LVIELDGGHHGHGLQAELDRARDLYFAGQGYRVLRFWNNDVITNIDGVLSAIAAAIAKQERPPTPDPSPPLGFASRGEGKGGKHARRLHPPHDMVGAGRNLVM
jgi:hypothetical protein